MGGSSQLPDFYEIGQKWLPPGSKAKDREALRGLVLDRLL
jgi:hypothetical protein